MSRTGQGRHTPAINVRLPVDAQTRVHLISDASVRSMSSLTVFALGYFLNLSESDTQRFIDLSKKYLRPGSDDPTVRFSTSDSTQAWLADSLAQTYVEKYRVPAARTARLYRAALLAWLDSGTDAELIAQVGAPMLPKEAISA